MDKLIILVDNTTETLDEKLFEEFMKTISVCGYANISKESYLSLSRDHYNHEKEKSL